MPFQEPPRSTRVPEATGPASVITIQLSPGIHRPSRTNNNRIVSHNVLLISAFSSGSHIGTIHLKKDNHLIHGTGGTRKCLATVVPCNHLSTWKRGARREPPVEAASEINNVPPSPCVPRTNALSVHRELGTAAASHHHRIQHLRRKTDVNYSREMHVQLRCIRV